MEIMSHLYTQNQTARKNRKKEKYILSEAFAAQGWQGSRYCVFSSLAKSYSKSCPLLLTISLPSASSSGLKHPMEEHGGVF